MTQPILAQGAGSFPSDSYWKSLRYFNLYRFVVASLLFVSAFVHPTSFELLPATDRSLYLTTASGYWLITFISVMVLHRWHRRFSLQLSGQVLLDVVVITLLMHASGGLKNGLGAMLLVSLAGAGLVGQGRMVVFYAALATLAILFEQMLISLGGEFDAGAIFQAGLLSAGFFASAISARLLARRVVANEELARHRGIELQNQVHISQRVIEEMQDGVLVVSPQGLVRLHNPQAELLLGITAGEVRQLSDYAPELAEHFRAWRLGDGRNATIIFRSGQSGKQVFARLLGTASSEGDILILLEDMGRLQEESRQLKLAALGRLTANIAHEIRNPLSAINHAGELLREASSTDSQEARLVRIVLDNAQRLERIVRDVLEVGRRDRRKPEPIDLAAVLPGFVEDFQAREKLPPGLLVLGPLVPATLEFDRAHFNQVLWNLLSNALRHSRRQAGSVLLSVRSGLAGQIELHVQDDGEGIGPDLREQVFEPFFTTHNKGTGLGLYIARELCEANGASLELLDGGPGAHFRIVGRSVVCQ